jgi:RES domain-containing protein
MLRAWRMVAARHSATAFEGEGVRLYGGRWNSPGLPAVYVAGSRALAALEILVHLSGEELGIRWERFEVRFHAKWCEQADVVISADAIGSPVVSPQTQYQGDQWLKSGKKPVLRVRSAVIPEEDNYLLNPLHPQFKQLEINPAESFTFDPRLTEQGQARCSRI